MTSLQTEGPFVYYDGRRVPLTEDRSRVLVSMEPGRSPTMLDSVFSNRGLSGHHTGFLGGSESDVFFDLSQASDSLAKDALVAIRGRDGVAHASAAYSTGTTPFWLDDMVMVGFEGGVGEGEVMALAEELALTLERRPNPELSFSEYRFSVGPTDDVLAVAAALYQHELVDWASPNKIYESRLDGIPSDPFFDLQYYLSNTETRFGIPVDIDVTAAWDSTTGVDVIVAVIDNGVKMDHLDLTRVQLGYDAVPETKGGLGGFDFSGCDDCASSPADGDAHGTSVAGIIGGQHDGAGIAGVAPSAWIYPLRMHRQGLEEESWKRDAINVAWGFYEADVINNSWGAVGSVDEGIRTAVDSAVTHGRNGKGTIVVFSSGNDFNTTDINAEAKLPGVLAVGGVDRYGFRPGYANTSADLDIVAPTSELKGCDGDVVTTALSIGGCSGDAVEGNSDYTDKFGGTSAAAPQATGAAALLLSVDGGLTSAQAISRLTTFADGWGISGEFGSGKLNVFRALFPPDPPTVTLSGPSMVPPSSTCTWTTSATGEGSLLYEWWIDTTRQTEQGSSLTITTPTSDFTVRVRVGDNWDQWSDIETMNVTVTDDPFVLCAQ